MRQDETAELLGDDHPRYYHLPTNGRRTMTEPQPRALEDAIAAEEGTRLDIGGGAEIAVRNGVLIQVFS